VGPLVSPPISPGALSCLAAAEPKGSEVLPSQLPLAKLSTGRVFERSRSLFFFSFSQYNPYRDVIIWCCFSSEFSLISCLWFGGFVRFYGCREILVFTVVVLHALKTASHFF